jgi:hypothetical protein
MYENLGLELYVFWEILIIFHLFYSRIYSLILKFVYLIFNGLRNCKFLNVINVLSLQALDNIEEGGIRI